jgi:hypothetical protein
MARGGSSAESGGIYHVIANFTAKEWFIDSEGKRQMYLALFGAALATSDWRCFAYAVMSSHIHLALVAGRDSLASWMRSAHTSFARWLNDTRGRKGAVFVKGPNFLAYEPQGVGRLINYIHCNPVRGGAASAPHLSTWTSHRAYLGLAARPEWLDVRLGLELAGFSAPSELDAWIEVNPVGREEVDAFLSTPAASRGRPRKVA